MVPSLAEESQEQMWDNTVKFGSSNKWIMKEKINKRQLLLRITYKDVFTIWFGSRKAYHFYDGTEFRLIFQVHSSNQRYFVRISLEKIL